MTSERPTAFGEVLQQLRTRKHLRQQSLAEQLGVHRNTIGAWERGDRLPETRGLVLELAKHLHLDEQETRWLLEASLTSLSPYWHVPHPRNPFFTGRLPLLERLHAQLSQRRAVALSQSYAISGLGGIGKTQLALEYAYQYANAYHAVFWLSAESRETLTASCASLAGLLGLPEAKEREQQQLVLAVLRWLSTHKGWLLIFDNLEELSLLQEALPPARQGAVLITTRLHALGGLAHTVELPPFGQKEGIAFLLARAGLTDPARPLSQMPSEVREAAAALVEAMEGLPLALDQAAAYIERTGCGLSDYLHLFEEHQVHLLAERSQTSGHPHSVAQTVRLSFERVASRHKGAADLLQLCAVLHPEAMSEDLLTEALRQAVPAAADPLTFQELMAEVLRLSLVSRSGEQRTVSVHRLVQAVLWEMMSQAERQQWVQRAIAALDTLFPSVEHANWPQCERLLPHTLLCLQRAETGADDLVLASLASKAGRYLRERGRYGEAEPLFQRALRIREQVVGAEQVEVAHALRDLADVYFSQGKYAQAEPFAQRALRILEQQVGPEHPDLAPTLGRLATLYAEQGRYGEAGPFAQRALRILEQQAGPEHPDVASILHRLAVIYDTQGKYAEAEPLYQRALRIWEQMGPEHPQVARTLNNLAALYFDQGKYTEAESFHQRALHMWERIGPEHPEMAIVLNNLAELYQTQGKYAEAEPLYQRALRIWEQQVGPEHPDLAHPLNGLAELYREQGKYAEAEPLFQRALCLAEQQVGPEHPNVADSLQGLAGLYQAQGKHTEAELLYQRALSIRERALEPSHPDTSGTLHNFATLREAQSNLQEAVPLYQRALSIRQQVLGPAHAKTSETREHLRIVLLALGRDAEAAQLEVAPPEQAVPAREHETRQET